MEKDQETTIAELKERLLKFREERDWAQFHNPKDLAEAISIEAAELQELFLWQDVKTIVKKIKDNPEYKKEVEEEFADVVIFALNFANATGIDVAQAVKNKIEKNDKKYPADKAKGTATKYTKL